jgi:hypothetical protein
VSSEAVGRSGRIDEMRSVGGRSSLRILDRRDVEPASALSPFSSESGRLDECSARACSGRLALARRDRNETAAFVRGMRASAASKTGRSGLVQPSCLSARGTGVRYQSEAAARERRRRVAGA